MKDNRKFSNHIISFSNRYFFRIFSLINVSIFSNASIFKDKQFVIWSDKLDVVL